MIALVLTLLLSLSARPSGTFDQVVRGFVDALHREDEAALTPGALGSGSPGLARTMLVMHNEVVIDDYRLISVEPGRETTLLLVETEGSAATVGTGARVPWPRLWSLEVKQGANGWELVSSMTLEYRLARDALKKTPAELDAILEAHPHIDVDRFVYLVADVASETMEGCPAVTWALREAQERGLIEAESMAWQMLSYLATLNGDGAAAMVYAQRTMALAKVIGTPDALADSTFSVAVAHWFSGRIPEAVKTMVEVASYEGQVSDPRLVLRSLYMAGYLEHTHMRLREALVLAEWHRRSLERWPHTRGRLDNAFMLGSIHQSLGNSEIARRYHEEGRAVAREIGDRQAEAMALYNIAMHAFALGTPDARATLEDAYALGAETLPAEHFTIIQRSLATARSDEGDFDGAERLFEEMLPAVTRAQHRDVFAGYYTARSIFRLRQGRLEEALADARQAREHEGANLAQASSSLAAAFTAEGHALRRLSRNDEAERAWRSAIETTEAELAARPVQETAAARDLKAILEPYHALLDLLVERGCARDALIVAERMRARSLRESLRHGRVDLRAGLDETLRERERQLELALAEANRAVLAATGAEAGLRATQTRHEARLALREFRSELYATHPDLSRRRPSDESDSWEPAPAGPGEVVIELAVNDDATIAFVLRGGVIEAHRIAITRAALEAQVNAFVSALEQRDFAYRQPARALYDLLLGPVAKDLQPAQRIRIVPDGVLWRLPFHALIDRRGKHLAERMPVVYSPSLALSRTRGNAEAAPRTLLALADPAIGSATADATRALYRDVTLGRLPDAAAEAKAIAAMYSGAQVRVGADAQETLFKSEAPAFRVLHLATHSILDDGAPMFSSIVLAESKSNPLDDGLLEAREIAELDLHADLAVLSACETARGAVTPGEGVVGLSWAFLASGVPTTVVSQWKVGSASTADLMVRFHRGIRGGATAAEALRMASAEVRRNPRWRHPFYWAPFVVIENSGVPAERQ